MNAVKLNFNCRAYFLEDRWIIWTIKTYSFRGMNAVKLNFNCRAYFLEDRWIIWTIKTYTYRHLPQVCVIWLYILVSLIIKWKQNKNKHTVGSVPNSNRDLRHSGRIGSSSSTSEQIYHTVRTVPKSNRNIIEKGTIYIYT